MSIVDTLKWMWDPRDKDEKEYDSWDTATPLKRHTQIMNVYIKNIEQPFNRMLEYEDRHIGSFGNLRVDLNDEVSKWLAQRGTKGIRIDTVWYSPEMIERIELVDTLVEDI